MVDDGEKLGLLVGSYGSDDERATSFLSQLYGFLKDRFSERSNRSIYVIEKTMQQKNRLNETISRVRKIEGIKL